MSADDGKAMVDAATHPVGDPVTQLVADLQFRPVDGFRAFGEIEGLPTTLMVVSDDPLAMTFDLRVNLPAEQLDAMRPTLEGLSDSTMRVSVYRDEVQLALLNLTGQTADAIRELVTEFAQSLKAAGLDLPEGCLYCGTTEEVGTVHHEGRTSRACVTCFTQRLEQLEAEQAERDRPRRNAWMGVPALGFYVALGWAGAWMLADWLLDWFRVQVIEINKFTSAVFFVGLLIIGGVLGTPLGSVLKKTGLVRRAPRWLGGLFVAVAVALGELLYVMLLLFRFGGVIDLTVAAQLMPLVIGDYSTFWISMKIGLALAIGLFAVIAIEEPVPRKSAL